MPHTEEQIEELIREMYTTGDSADWEIDPEKIRSQRARLRMPVPDVKVLVLVAAAVILIVVGIVVANGSPSRRSAASLPTTTLSDPNSVEAPNLVGPHSGTGRHRSRSSWAQSRNHQCCTEFALCGGSRH